MIDKNKFAEEALKCLYAATEDFDYRRVYKAMECMEWYWKNEDRQPSIDRMHEHVIDLGKKLIEMMISESNDNDYLTTSSGGFRVDMYAPNDKQPSTFVEILFVLEESEMDFDWLENEEDEVEEVVTDTIEDLLIQLKKDLDNMRDRLSKLERKELAPDSTEYRIS